MHNLVKESVGGPRPDLVASEPIAFAGSCPGAAVANCAGLPAGATAAGTVATHRACTLMDGWPPATSGLAP